MFQVISCSARPDSISRRDHHEENSLPNEIPEDIAKDVNSQKKEQAFNENELQIEGLSDKTSSAIVNSFQSQSNPEQLQQLKDILSLEMKNKDKFAQIYSQMNPEQVKKIRELVLKIGQQTGSPELIQFGQCKLPQFNEKQVQALIGLGEALYDRLNTETTGVQMNRASFSSQGDQSDMFGQMKASIGNQQAFIRRLVNMIEVQLSKAPQIDAAEFAEVKGIMEEIKALSNQVQSRIQKANNLSQLTDMGDQLLKINNLSSKLQHKVSAELLEDRMKEYLNSMSNTNPQQATESTGNMNQATDSSADSVQLQARDTNTETETQIPFTPQEKPQGVSNVERFLGGVQWFLENMRRERQQQLLEQANPQYISKYATQAIRQVQQQYPQVANTLPYVQQQYPQVNSAIQNIQQQQYPQVSDAIQTLQQQNTGLTNKQSEQQTPELLTTQNADGSLTLQAAEQQQPQETTNTVETNLTPESNTLSTEQQNLETTNVDTNVTPEATNTLPSSQQNLVDTSNTVTASS